MVSGIHAQMLSDIVYYFNHPLHEMIMHVLYDIAFVDLTEFCILQHVSLSNAILLLLSRQWEKHTNVAQNYQRQLMTDQTMIWLFTTWRTLEMTQCNIPKSTVSCMSRHLLIACESTVRTINKDVWEIIIDYVLKYSVPPGHVIVLKVFYNLLLFFLFFL
jgi:hypothetical protein